MYVGGNAAENLSIYKIQADRLFPFISINDMSDILVQYIYISFAAICSHWKYVAATVSIRRNSFGNIIIYFDWKTKRSRINSGFDVIGSYEHENLFLYTFCFW